MDRWTLVLSGLGPHHSSSAADVDKLAAAFMAALRDAGHAELAGKLTLMASETTVEPAPKSAAPALAKAKASEYREG